MMKEKIVIVGAGGFGREVYSLIDKEKYILVGFIDRSPNKEINLPLPIIGDDSLIPKLVSSDIATNIIIAIGEMKKRRAIYDIVIRSKLKIPTIIHHSAIIASSVQVYEGVIIYPNVVVMSDCIIRKGVILNAGSTIGHDVTIGDFSNINPGVNLSGRINIGKEVLIGIGACVRENITIEDRAIIGAGSVVIKNVSKNTMVFGVPAKTPK